MRLIPRVVSLLLTPILIFGPLSAQTISSPALPSNAAVSQALQLRLVDGESAEVPVGSRALEGFLIEVNDSSGAAVREAAVVFRLPDTGPTGAFADGTRSAVAYTDQTGRVKFTGIQWNGAPGVVAIRVTAVRGTAHAGILIQQTLAPVSTGALAKPPSQPTPETLPVGVTQLPLPPPPPTDTQVMAKTSIVPGQPTTSIAPWGTQPPVQSPEPAVSVTSASPGESRHSGKTKWIILAAVAAGAGVGVAMMGRKSAPSSTTSTGISIGPPTVSVGH